jgi:hypothetical protein
VNPPQGYHWEDAHYPSPQRYGEKTVRLWYPHHIIQGCLQTLELNEPCIHGCKRHKERQIVEVEFPEYLPLFDQAIAVLQKYANKKAQPKIRGNSEVGANGRKKCLELKLGVHSEEYRHSVEYKETRIHNGEMAVKNKTGIHDESYKSRPEYIEERRAAFALANSQKWVSLADGFISNAGGVAKHNRKIGADPYARRKL